MHFKSRYLPIVILLMICLTLAQERSPEDYEMCKKHMKTDYERYTGIKGEVEDFTAKEYAKGVVLNWELRRITFMDSVTLPYFNKVAHNIIPGDIQLRGEFCQKTICGIPVTKLFDRKNKCLDELKVFGDSQRLALNYARNEISFDTLDETKQKHTKDYLKHIAENIAFKDDVDDPLTFCMYYPEIDDDEMAFMQARLYKSKYRNKSNMDDGMIRMKNRPKYDEDYDMNTNL